MSMDSFREFLINFRGLLLFIRFLDETSRDFYRRFA